MVSLPSGGLERMPGGVAAFVESGGFELPVGTRRSILLALGEGEPGAGLWSATLSMMERLEAGVEILQRARSGEESSGLRGFLRDVARSGRSGRLIPRAEVSWETVVAHAGSLSGIVCILVDSLEAWGLEKTAARKRPPAWSARLPCPLVVVGDRAG